MLLRLRCAGPTDAADRRGGEPIGDRPTGSADERPCAECGRAIHCFDGSVSTSGDPRWRHLDCADAAKRNYPEIAARLADAGHNAKHVLWGEWMEATYDLPDDLRKRLDGLVFKMVLPIEDALREAWHVNE